MARLDDWDERYAAYEKVFPTYWDPEYKSLVSKKEFRDFWYPSAKRSRELFETELRRGKFSAAAYWIRVQNGIFLCEPLTETRKWGGFWDGVRRAQGDKISPPTVALRKTRSPVIRWCMIRMRLPTSSRRFYGEV